MGNKVESNSKALVLFILKLLSGPLAYLVVYNLPLAKLAWGAKVGLSVYAWLIAWWCLQPVPWVATAVIPLLILPATNLMPMKEVASKVYGQQIMYFLIFIFLFGRVIQKFNIGERLAMNMLSIKWINGSVRRFSVVYMVASCVLTALFGIVAPIGLIPIGIATINHIEAEYKKMNISYDKTKLSAFIMLSSLFGAEAGNVITLQAVPHNILVLQIAQDTVGYTASYLQWLLPGLIVGIFMLLGAYVVLRFSYKLSCDEIPGGVEYFRKQKEALGKLNKKEKIAATYIAVVILTWVFANFAGVKWLDFYWVSIIGLVAAYIIPVDIKNNEFLLGINDIKTINWNIIFLITSAVGFTSLITSLGVIKYIASMLTGIGGNTILFIAALVTPLLTNFLAGMAAATAMGTLLLPIASKAGINPMIITRIIPAMSVGFVLPWAGTFAAMYFGSEKLSMKEMFKTGWIYTLVMAATVTVGYSIFVPLLHAFTIIAK